MKESLRLILIGGIALSYFAASGLALAQPAPPAPAGPGAPGAAPHPPPQGAPTHPQQLSETHGTVQRFTLTPRGELDGFLLADGTQVHLPPHLSGELAAAVRIGDPVTVHGYRSPHAPLVVASAATDTSTNQTVTDQGPPPGAAPPPAPPGAPAPGAQQASLTGRVQNSLYGPAGDLDGAVLSDGTIIRMAPGEASQVSHLLAPGQTIDARGWALNTAYGKVVDAQTINPASAQAPPPPPAPGTPFRPAPPPPR